MATAKLNSQHDYITLRVKFEGGRTLNLTRSHSGTKVSGTEATRAALDFFEAWIKAQKGTVGESMQRLRALAEKSATMRDFLAAIEVPAAATGARMDRVRAVAEKPAESKPTLRKRMPRGFRRGHDDSLSCPHRDVSCCKDCVERNAEIVEVFGRHFWVADEAERRELGVKEDGRAA